MVITQQILIEFEELRKKFTPLQANIHSEILQFARRLALHRGMHIYDFIDSITWTSLNEIYPVGREYYPVCRVITTYDAGYKDPEYMSEIEFPLWYLWEQEKALQEEEKARQLERQAWEDARQRNDATKRYQDYLVLHAEFGGKDPP